MYRYVDYCSLLYLGIDADLTFICGDINARVGEHTDLLTDQIKDIRADYINNVMRNNADFINLNLEEKILFLSPYVEEKH